MRNRQSNWYLCRNFEFPKMFKNGVEFLYQGQISTMQKLFQIDHPNLANSKVIISGSESAIYTSTIFLNGLNFLNSYWMLYSVNLEMVNCQAASLSLELNELANVTIQNCTFGNWTFRQTQDIFIENVRNIFNEGSSTSLNFYNSSAFIEGITIEHDNTGHLQGISAQDFSILYIKQSNFLNNTVIYGLIKVLNLSYLIMSNSAVLGNYAEEYAGAIYANKSLVNLTNTYFTITMQIGQEELYWLRHYHGYRLKTVHLKIMKLIY